MVLGGKIAVSLYLQPIRKTVRFRMRQRLSTDLTAEERQEEKPRRGIPEVVMGNFAETSRRVQTLHLSARTLPKAGTFSLRLCAFTFLFSEFLNTHLKDWL